MRDGRRVLVTGGCGFIGSNFILYLLRNRSDVRVINLDCLTYAGNRSNLLEAEGDPRYRFVLGDVRDSRLVNELAEEADVIVNFAAQTHVDRSLMDGASFIATNVHGVFVLLDALRRHKHIRKLVHISTDEVYGETSRDRPASESDPLRPRNPYAASKAGADLLCLSFHTAHGLPVVIVRPVNIVGPRQHPEKVVPLFVTSALQDLPLPVYGDGRQVRDWLYVEDFCRALELIIEQGEPGQVYNVAGDNPQENIHLAESILDILGKPRSLIRLVPDRPGHDRSYALEAAKVRRLGWSPEVDFRAALERTVAWYRDNAWWWRAIYDDPAFRAYYRQQYGSRLAQGVPYRS